MATQIAAVGKALGTVILSLVVVCLLGACAPTVITPGESTSPDLSAAATPMPGEDLTAGSPTTAPATPTQPVLEAGCWLLDGQASRCGALLSVSGQAPGAVQEDLSGALRLSARDFAISGDDLVLIIEKGQCRTTTSLPIAIRDGVWTPDAGAALTDLTGCVGGGDTPIWALNLLFQPFDLAIIGDSDALVQLSSPSGSLVFKWE